VTGLLRDELQFKGVVLSDDLEMKAIAAHHAVPEAAVLALGAGCDGVLVCGPNHDVHAAVLEALIHAVEEERLPRSRVEDALDRGRRAKERFLTSQVAARPPSSRALRQQIGLDEHRAIADEMSRYL